MYRLLFFFVLTLISCRSTRNLQSDLIATSPEENSTKITFTQELENTLRQDDIWKDHLVGFVLADANGKELININGNKYFTPASNVKLLSYYTCLYILDSLEAVVEYSETDNALYFRGTGHPALLHPNLPTAEKTLALLGKSQKTLIYAPQDFLDKSYNPGWALDDVTLSYQTDKSSLPIYGNTALITKAAGSDIYSTTPKALNKYLRSTAQKHYHPYRDLYSNAIYISDSISTTRTINKLTPFISNPELIINILQDQLARPVLSGNTDTPYRALNSYPTAPLYKELLLHSDNHIAEQLLLMSAYKTLDTFNTQQIIDYSLKNTLSDIPDTPRWVDGSGLSRYNLLTPRSLTWLLQQIRETVDLDTLNSYLPAIELTSGGPKAYAKTGSLSNNFNLSGYLRCKSGNTYCFSFMNNHYMQPRKVVVAEVKKVLLRVYEEY